MPFEFERQTIRDVILVKPWDFQADEKADVIWRYTKTESNWLERKGYLKM